jgi:hypothetical protein
MSEPALAPTFLPAEPVVPDIDIMIRMRLSTVGRRLRQKTQHEASSVGCELKGILQMRREYMIGLT